MTYAWKDTGRKVYKTDAQIAGEECERLRQQNRLTAAELVNESRPETAPLHREFEWNDFVAAEEFRKEQARNIIQAIIVVPERENVQPVRAFYNVYEAKPVYEKPDVIVQNEDMYAALLKRALRELQAMANRYSMIKELGGVRAAIEQVAEQWNE